MYYGRVISISCRRVTPFWHGCHEIKFRNMGRKKILNGFLESLSDFKNLCQSRILVFVLVCDLQKRTPKSKNIIKNIQNQLQNDKNIIKNQKIVPKSKSRKRSKFKILIPRKNSPLRQHSKNAFRIFLRFL